MGVSGSGKTTVGKRLAKSLDIDFVDGDDLHPIENVERMKAGVKLDDETRKPWLAAICECAETYFAQSHSVIVACSALNQSYLNHLRRVYHRVQFVFLKGSQEVIAERLESRSYH